MEQWTSLGGHAAQYSYWNGFDLTAKAGTDKLKEDLLEKRAASCVDDSLKVESLKQIRSQTCWFRWLQLCQLVITRSFKKVLIVDFLSKGEQQALNLATEEEQETARTTVSRLHV